jgi:glycosyltransferase involved in cell wall biosynthesis
MAPGSIAVVIPTYNRLELLRATLRSVVEQERPPERIVVVDDGSTDGSAEWVEASTDAVLLRNPGGGWGPARGRREGARLAETELIAFIDSDDLMLPTALGRLEAALAAAPEAPFAFGRALVAARDESGWHPEGLIAPEPVELADPLPALFARNFVPSVGTLARRAPIERLGGYPTDLVFAEDHYFWILLAQLADPVYVPELTSVYRVHRGNRHTPARAEEEIDAFLALADADPRLAPARAGRLGVQLCENASPLFPADPRALAATARRTLLGRRDKRAILAAAAVHWRRRRRRDAAARRIWAADPDLRAWLGDR